MLMIYIYLLLYLPGNMTECKTKLRWLKIINISNRYSVESGWTKFQRDVSKSHPEGIYPMRFLKNPPGKKPKTIFSLPHENMN